MPKIVRRYPLTPGLNLVSMKQGAELCGACEDGGFVSVWAILHTDSPDRVRAFYVVQSENAILAEYGTHFAVVKFGTETWHVFAGAWAD